MEKSLYKYYSFKDKVDFDDAIGRSGHLTRKIKRRVKRRTHKRIRRMRLYGMVIL